MKILLKDFSDDNFELDENGRKFSKRVENTIGKGEIARYEQFLLFPECFQKTCTVDTTKTGLFGKGLGGKIAGYLHFLYFLRFLPSQRQRSHFF